MHNNFMLLSLIVRDTNDRNFYSHLPINIIFTPTTIFPVYAYFHTLIYPTIYLHTTHKRARGHKTLVVKNQQPTTMTSSALQFQRGWLKGDRAHASTDHTCRARHLSSSHISWHDGVLR